LLTLTQALVDGSSALGPRVGRNDCLAVLPCDELEVHYRDRIRSLSRRWYSHSQTPITLGITPFARDMKNRACVLCIVVSRRGVETVADATHPYLIQGTVILPPLPRSLTCSKMKEADGTAATSRPGYQGKGSRVGRKTIDASGG
jgi:hypothetical protein